MANKPFMNKRRSLYEFEWQLLRVSLDFHNLNKTQESVVNLRTYLREQNYRPRAVYKVINLCSAVAMNFHTATSRVANSETIDDMLAAIQLLRESITTPAYLKCNDIKEWEIDDTVRRADLMRADIADIHKIKQSLTKRWVTYMKRDIKKISTRPELLEYIELLEEELRRRASLPITGQK